MPAPKIIKCPITGEDTTITKLSELSGVPRDCLRWRVSRGKTGRELLEPINPNYQRRKPYRPVRQRRGANLDVARETPLAMPLNRIAHATHIPLDDNHREYMKRITQEAS
ncbi:hypothetical protein ACLUEY_01140 [Vreelandella aquamarina]